MNLRTLAAFLTLLLPGAALAAPAVYTFSTGVTGGQHTPLNLNGSPPTAEQFATSNAIASLLAGTTVSGSFVYDSQAMLTGPTSGGSLGNRGSVYGGHLLPNGTPYSSFQGLSGSVNGSAPRVFNDPRGLTIVGNNAFQGVCFPQPCTPPALADFLQFQAESGTGASIRNISGFSIFGDYRLFNVRLFWLEGQMVPALIEDFLDSQNLPGTPPLINGRLALDFVHLSDTNGVGTQYIVFYDGLFATAAIPEPETYALLLAGLGLLGFVARRRRT
ncbi:MAG TPA: PEP-CTERM sorting domain-containing protein [Burkholderiales bacterium]|nr:PEP-CTERM sorting domain-containing protein [Burkholderiales bacterium]